MMLQTKYQSSRPSGFGQDLKKMFPYISLYKTFDPQDMATFGPMQGGILIMVNKHYNIIIVRTEIQ